jgi:hypothetical protein
VAVAVGLAVPVVLLAAVGGRRREETVHQNRHDPIDPSSSCPDSARHATLA